MPIRKPKPTSPGRRFVSYPDFAEITKSKPEKTLVEGLKKSGGRNAHGRKTARHRGGGAKRAYRRVDFKRRKDGVQARVAAIEYDPNRSAYIALLHYVDGEKRYILAPQRLTVGMMVASGEGADIAVGNCMELARMPVGTVVHNIELQPGRGGQMARSAGASAQLMAKDGDMATLRLPSGEMRMVRAECRATVGVIGNAEHQNVKVGKAGRKRHMGVRPQTRGVAMNPVDHPHGGGEGSTTAGRHPVTPWGVPTLGYRTRKTEQDLRPLHRARPPPREGQAAMSRSSKKGPWVEERLMTRIEALNAANNKKMMQHLVARIDDLPRDGRPHDRRARRQETRARVHQRVDGRPQARRVRAHARVPRPRRIGEGAMSADDETTAPDGQTAGEPDAAKASSAKKPAAAKKAPAEKKPAASAEKKAGEKKPAAKKPAAAKTPAAKDQLPRRKPLSPSQPRRSQPRGKAAAEKKPAAARRNRLRANSRPPSRPSRNPPKRRRAARPQRRRRQSAAPARRARPRPLRADLGAQGAHGVRPPARQVGAGGTRYPRVHPS